MLLPWRSPTALRPLSARTAMIPLNAGEARVGARAHRAEQGLRALSSCARRKSTAGRKAKSMVPSRRPICVPA